VIEQAVHAAVLGRFVADARLRQAVASIHRAERDALADQRTRAHELGAARARWLHRNGADASFPCGVTRPVLPEAADGSTLRERRTEVQVIAAVLPDRVTFLVEPPESLPSWDPIEAGTIDRGALREVDVVDANGAHVPEPLAESFDPEPEVELVLRWDGDTQAEQRLTFRSAWLAWKAARRFLAVMSCSRRGLLPRRAVPRRRRPRAGDRPASRARWRPRRAVDEPSPPEG